MIKGIVQEQMARNISVKILYILLYCLHIQYNVYCMECSVYKKIADCRSQSLVFIPQDLPSYIEELKLSHNPISDVGSCPPHSHSCIFFRYNALKVLDLSFCQITNLSETAFYGLAHIEHLTIEFNQITELKNNTFTYLKSLRYLQIGHNSFNAVPDHAFNLPFLHILDISRINEAYALNIKIGEGFRKLTKLQRLVIADNGINILKDGFFTNLESLTHLVEIDLPGNSMTKIEHNAFKPLIRVKRINLSDNRFNKAEFRDALYGVFYTNATAIYCFACLQLEYLDNTTFDNLRHRSELHIETIAIPYSNLSDVHEFTFAELPHLRHINLSSNNFKIMNNNPFGNLSPSVESIELIYNPFLTDINQTFMIDLPVTSIDLSLTGLTSLRNASFQGAKNLTHISINMMLQKLDDDVFYGLESLKVLDLSDNRVCKTYSRYAFRGPRKLEELIIDGINIQNFSYSLCDDIPTVTHVSAENLRSKNLSYEMFRNCSNLKSLDFIGGYNLEHINWGFKDIPSLDLLDLSSNSLAEPIDGAFNISRKFKTLLYTKMHPVHNEHLITRLPKALSHASNIDLLDIRWNGIQGFNLSELRFFENLQTLLMLYNDFNCTCSNILYFVKWLDTSQSFAIARANLSGFICYLPENMTGKLVYHLDTYFCDYPNIYIRYEVPIPLALIVVVVLIIGVIAWRHRYTLKYFWYYLKIQKEGKLEDEDEDVNPFIMYDAFISYNIADLPFVKQVLLPKLESLINPEFPQIFVKINKEIRYRLDKLAHEVAFCVRCNVTQMNRPLTKRINKRCIWPRLRKIWFTRKAKSHNRTINIDTFSCWAKIMMWQNFKQIRLKSRKRMPLFGKSTLKFDNSTVRYRKSLQEDRKLVLLLKQYDKKISKVRIYEEEMAEEQRIILNNTSEYNSDFSTLNSYPQFDDWSVADILREEQSRKYRYKLMICQRDFPVGTDVAETIVEYMMKSRRSIICLSKQFIDHKWTMFEMEITARERQNSMLVILLEDIPLDHLPKTIRNLIRKKLYLKWTADEEYGQKLFWAKLRRFLGKPLEQIRKEKADNQSLFEPWQDDTEEQSLQAASISVQVVSSEDNSVWINSDAGTLTKHDKSVLLNKTESVTRSDSNDSTTTKMMNYCMSLLQSQFPDIEGFQNTYFTERIEFEKKPFIQPIHIANEWVLISNLKCIEGVVRIYDSANRHVVSESLQNIVAKMMNKFHLSEITFQLVKVSQHASKSDSWLHAIANSVALLNNKSPSNITYLDSDNLRKHLSFCLEKEAISCFPEKSLKTKNGNNRPQIRLTKIIELHCKCRMPKSRTMKTCLKCKCYYHISCYNMLVNSMAHVCASCIRKKQQIF